MGEKLKKIPLRIILYTKDVINITGRADRFCRRMLAHVKDVLGKTKKQLVTVKEFCQVYGIPEDHVNSFL